MAPTNARDRTIRLRRSLLAWFDRSGRDLPWRSRRTPWRVWVSEVMLQQTRVEAVVDPYRRFLAAFPSLASLARAEEAEVLALWSGLGYYRRARLLHAGARYVVEHHRGRIPRSREELRRVPGVGAYTSSALLSIAFGQREAALDANVTRVVARLQAVGDPRSARGRAAVAAAATALVDCERPGDVNEALMDLGSSICTARQARCQLCPLSRECRGRARGDAAAIAGPRARKPPRRVQLACAVVTRGPRVLFLQRPADDRLLAGLWDLPTVEDDGVEAGDPAAALRRLLRRRSGLDVVLEGPVASVAHDIVGRRIVARVYAGRVRSRARLPADARLLSEEERPGVGLPALPVKILRALSRRGPARLRAARGAG